MFTSSHSVHALATYLRTVCENMQKQVCQLGQSKRVIGREPYMWLGGLAGSLGCLVLITDLRIQPLCPRQVRASRTAASRHAWAVFTSSQVQYGCPSARGCCSACPPVLQATYGPYQLGFRLPEGDYVFMCFPPSFLRSRAPAVTRISESSYRRNANARSEKR